MPCLLGRSIRVITLLKQTDPQLKFEAFSVSSHWRAEVAPAGNPKRRVLARLMTRYSRCPPHPSCGCIEDQRQELYLASNMDDVEHVLRFFTISDRWQQIGQLLTEEMDSFMRDNRKPTTSKLNELRNKFEFSLDACQKIFGNRAFYKPQGAGWRGQFISPLFDAEMVAALLTLYRVEDSQTSGRSPRRSSSSISQ